MAAAIQPPFLSRFDPGASSEGGIDPLGTGAFYEQLAERVLPHITGRMSRPRFLTAIAAASHVCAGFEEELAADGVTPAWLVFEWYVAEAFMRREDDFGERPSGIPGVRKVRAALQAGRHLNTSSYLKTAKVFGYTGVYRRLAVGLEVISDDHQIAEGGYELLRAWEADQRLNGFVAGAKGPGSALRGELQRAVERGITGAATAKPDTWDQWPKLMQTLRPDRIGPKECGVLTGRLSRTDLKQNPHDLLATSMRKELIEQVVENGELLERHDEPDFFSGLLLNASAELRERLELIDAYEGLCLPIESSFRYVLHASTRAGPSPVRVDEVAGHPYCTDLAKRIQPAARRLSKAAVSSEDQSQLAGLLDRYGEITEARALVESVLEHHEENQKRKPPDGKRPWFERLQGHPVVRQKYAHEEAPPNHGYVHDYRCNTVSTFLRDLGRL